MQLVKEAQHSQFHSGKSPVQNLRTTPRHNGEKLVRLYNGENKSICVEYTLSIEGESVKWKQLTSNLIGMIDKVIPTQEELFWTCRNGGLFSLDLDSDFKILSRSGPKLTGKTSLNLVKNTLFAFHDKRISYKNYDTILESYRIDYEYAEWEKQKSNCYHSFGVINVSDKLYCVGPITQVFDPVCKSMTTCKQMPGQCTSGSVVALGGKLFVVGGKEKVCLRYDPATDAWTTLSPPTTTSANYKATAWKGKIMLYDTEANEAEVYDPGFDRWTLKTGLFDEETKKYGTKALWSMTQKKKFFFFG
ncbi:hypothetical protein CAPTEDRAFT_213973 [Capitella teleta]|uniref:Uncharacterized protein n=1 Tax=Capitella teleta TaxID=283909 RepID=R7TW98_CAPTE|nr:hypothetical protein CAPTEDRAFT_213973 [Capitella teleta]|eukprot:ELT95260.1 hypothetical protein CAPTEDRAFT_213973 [Capitella teleta]